MDQNTSFGTGEADAWYRRNRAHLENVEARESHDIRYISETLFPFRADIDNILEIGCSSGVKLEEICIQLEASGKGVDPSNDAVLDGNKRIKSDKIELIQATGDILPFDDHRFDFVYFGFCLYLFDRKMIIRSLSEADRVLKPGGFLAITDFDPGSPRKREYSHKAGIFSYKQDYALPYIQSHLYYLVGKKSFSHQLNHFDKVAEERVATQILYKELDPYVG